MATYKFQVNGRAVSAESWDPAQPLLYVLRNQLGLHGPKFGCGLSQCGACTVLIDGKAARSCVTPVRGAEGRSVTTLEGLGTPQTPDPVQAAFIAEQAAPVRLLHQRHDHGREIVPGAESQADAGASKARSRWQSLPVRHAHAHPARRPAGGESVGRES